MRIRLRHSLLLSLMLLCLIGAIGYGLLATSTGSRWLLQRITGVAQDAGVRLQVGSVNGSLLSGLELRNLSASAEGHEVAVDQLRMQVRLRTLLHGTAHITQLDLNGTHVQLAPATSEERSTRIQIPDLRLPLTVQADQVQLTQIEIATANDQFSASDIRFGFRLDADNWSVTQLNLHAPPLTLAGQMKLAPRAPHALSAQISASGNWPDTGLAEARLMLGGHALRPSFSLELTAQGQLHAEGTLDLTRAVPQIDLTARLSEARWPLTGPAAVTVPEADLVLQGSAENYRLQLSGILQGTQFPQLQVQLDAHGDRQQLTAQPLTLHGLDGALTAQGSLSWAPALRWDLAVQARQINPGIQFAEWPGSLTADATLRGGHSDKGYEAEAIIRTLGGHLRDHPLRGSGGLYYHAGELNFNRVELQSGPNLLQIDGRADTHYNLSLALDAPNLNTLLPQAQGQLSGNARLTGSAHSPDATLVLKGNAIAFDQLRAETLQLNAEWRPEKANATLEGKGVHWGEHLLERATLTLEGTPAQHLIELFASHPDARLTLAAHGGLDAQRWSGSINTAQLHAPLWERWALLKPVNLTLQPDAVDSSELCLRQHSGAGQLCANGNWSATQGVDISATLTALPLKPLNAYLPGEAQVDGALSGTLQLQGPTDNLSATVALRPTDGTIELVADGETLQVPYRDVTLDARTQNGETHAQAALKLGADGYAQGSLTLGAAPAHPVNGALLASFPDLRLLEGFAPALEAVSGRLQLTLNAAGTLQRPLLSGGVALHDARARLPAAGLELSAPQITLQGTNSRALKLNGEIHSGPGKLILSGEIDPIAPRGPRLNIKVSGERFQAVRLPEADVEVSPDLTLTGVAPYHLAGTLTVPRAQIELRELPATAVSVSDDEIIVGEAPPARSASPLTAAVQVRLGEQVNFKGFGLTTRLTGTLNAAKSAEGSSAYGKIDLHEGLYKAYGQYLKIEQGRLLFAGPTDNPDVDLRAVRESRDGQVRAYLALNGPIARPDLRVSSVPALPEAEALAYLLTGRGLAQAGQQEGMDITAAALSLGLSRSEPLLQKMGDRLGLDDLRLEDNGNGASGSTLLLGKYLRPDLYLGYLQNLFSPQGVALLRLHLSDKLDLETRAGTTQSVDLLYRHEYD